MAALAQLALRAVASPGRWLAWLPVQQSFLDDMAKRKAFRAGNQFFGKTAALIEEMNRRAERRHPDPDMTYPRRMIVISPNQPQSVSLQKKLWESCDRRLLDPRTAFDPVIGFRGRYPACRWADGTIALFKSGEAGAISFAGETADDVFIDEPTTLRLYQEADRRVTIRGGYVIMGFTPINAKEPLDWLRQLVADGVVSEHHSKLVPEAMVPVGHEEPRKTKAGDPIDAAFIANQRKAVVGHDAAIILDGDWETPPEGQRFPAFDPRPRGGTHITTVCPTADLDLCIGIDHGERDNKQTAKLVGIEKAGRHPVVHVLDEYVGEGLTTPEQDAAGILAMLGRWGFRWTDLTYVYGDKPHDVRRKLASVARKGNADLQAAIARELNIKAANVRPPIRQVKKGVGGGRGSVDRGCRWLHYAMLREGHFKVQAGCEHTIKALSRWEGKDDEHKDHIDALRYATWKWAMDARKRYDPPRLEIH